MFQVRVQYIDLGKTEDCPISRLSNLPRGYDSIPFMAFHCALSEEEIKIDYEVYFNYKLFVMMKFRKLIINAKAVIIYLKYPNGLPKLRNYFHIYSFFSQYRQAMFVW